MERLRCTYAVPVLFPYTEVKLRWHKNACCEHERGRLHVSFCALLENWLCLIMGSVLLFEAWLSGIGWGEGVEDRLLRNERRRDGDLEDIERFRDFLWARDKAGASWVDFHGLKVMAIAIGGHA